MEWQDSWEPAATFEQCPDHWTRIKNDYESRKNRPAHSDGSRSLEDIADDQGWISPLVIDPAITAIGLQEVNPDKDIHPSEVYSLLADPGASDDKGHPTVVNCYDPQGRFLG